jgi:hypothetical protein
VVWTIPDPYISTELTSISFPLIFSSDIYYTI